MDIIAHLTQACLGLCAHLSPQPPDTTSHFPYTHYPPAHYFLIPTSPPPVSTTSYTTSTYTHYLSYPPTNPPTPYTHYTPTQSLLIASPLIPNNPPLIPTNYPHPHDSLIPNYTPPYPQASLYLAP
ncbi:uncharacterized protein LOC134769360 [Penaeus indicus]|uniref:uncharacterized protein LOC134769360 n=1 Tax=Penaeus indicus TaxID=29960 RepID=UPI00300C560E